MQQEHRLMFAIYFLSTSLLHSSSTNPSFANPPFVQRGGGHRLLST